MTRPATYPAARLLVGLAVLLLLAVVALGLDGQGPLHRLGGVTDEVVAWFDYNTDVLFR